MHRIRSAFVVLCLAGALVLGGAAMAEETENPTNPCTAKAAAKDAGSSDAAEAAAEEQAELPPVASGEDAAAEAQAEKK